MSGAPFARRIARYELVDDPTDLQAMVERLNRMNALLDHAAADYVLCGATCAVLTYDDVGRLVLLVEREVIR